MTKLHFKIDIDAPKETVWDVMLGEDTYRIWSGAFQEGSYYVGSWDKGSTIRFLAPDEDGGKDSGMVSKIVENIPHEHVSIEHQGEVVNGADNFTSEGALQWAGSYENYFLKEHEGMTTITVELEGDDIDNEMIEMLDEMWPPALEKLKEIIEQT